MIDFSQQENTIFQDFVPPPPRKYQSFKFHSSFLQVSSLFFIPICFHLHPRKLSWQWKHPPFEDVFFIASLVFSAVILRMAPCLLKHLQRAKSCAWKTFLQPSKQFAMESSNPDFLAKHRTWRKNVTSTPVKPAYKSGSPGRVLRCHRKVLRRKSHGF